MNNIQKSTMSNLQKLTKLNEIESEDNTGIDLLERPSETEPFAWGPHHISSPFASGNFGDLPIG
jgi:hypothetical protein